MKNVATLPDERWAKPVLIVKNKPIDFENYLVSTSGRVYSLRNERLLKLTAPPGEYVRISLVREKGKFLTVFVHRLVAATFIPNPSGKTHVNHLDGTRDNNSLTNLEWSSCKENINHGHSRRARAKNETLRQLLAHRPDLFEAAMQIKDLLFPGQQETGLSLKVRGKRRGIRFE